MALKAYEMWFESIKIAIFFQNCKNVKSRPHTRVRDNVPGLGIMKYFVIFNLYVLFLQFSDFDLNTVLLLILYNQNKKELAKIFSTANGRIIQSVSKKSLLV